MIPSMTDIDHATQFRIHLQNIKHKIDHNESIEQHLNITLHCLKLLSTKYIDADDGSLSALTMFFQAFLSNLLTEKPDHPLMHNITEFLDVRPLVIQPVVREPCSFIPIRPKISNPMHVGPSNTLRPRSLAPAPFFFPVMQSNTIIATAPISDQRTRTTSTKKPIMRKARLTTATNMDQNHMNKSAPDQQAVEWKHSQMLSLEIHNESNGEGNPLSQIALISIEYDPSEISADELTLKEVYTPLCLLDKFPIRSLDNFDMDTCTFREPYDCAMDDGLGYDSDLEPMDEVASGFPDNEAPVHDIGYNNVESWDFPDADDQYYEEGFYNQMDTPQDYSRPNNLSPDAEYSLEDQDQPERQTRRHIGISPSPSSLSDGFSSISNQSPARRRRRSHEDSEESSMTRARRLTRNQTSPRSVQSTESEHNPAAQFPPIPGWRSSPVPLPPAVVPPSRRNPDTMEIEIPFNPQFPLYCLPLERDELSRVDMETSPRNYYLLV
jgi:hypothetical protein